MSELVNIEHKIFNSWGPCCFQGVPAASRGSLLLPGGPCCFQGVPDAFRGSLTLPVNVNGKVLHFPNNNKQIIKSLKKIVFQNLHTRLAC